MWTGETPDPPLEVTEWNLPSLLPARGQLPASPMNGAGSCPPASVARNVEAARMGGERSRQEGL